MPQPEYYNLTPRQMSLRTGVDLPTAEYIVSGRVLRSATKHANAKRKVTSTVDEHPPSPKGKKQKTTTEKEKHKSSCTSSTCICCAEWSENVPSTSRMTTGGHQQNNNWVTAERKPQKQNMDLVPVHTMAAMDITAAKKQTTPAASNTMTPHMQLRSSGKRDHTTQTTPPASSRMWKSDKSTQTRPSVSSITTSELNEVDIPARTDTEEDTPEGSRRSPTRFASLFPYLVSLIRSLNGLQSVLDQSWTVAILYFKHLPED